MESHLASTSGNLQAAHETAAVYRIIDANANRAGEGLRVAEDYLRFFLQDEFLSRACKQLRHDLAVTISALDREKLLSCRSTLTDVGTSTKTDTEYDRHTLFDVSIANLRRSAEALRTLEEFAKLISTAAAEEFESLRYRSYTVEKAVNQLQRANRRLQRARLYVLANLSDSKWKQKIESLVSAGVDVVQLRDKTKCDRELVAMARFIRRATVGTGTLFIVNDRPDIAQLIQADGVHVGQEEMTVADVRSIVGPDMLIGVSTHTIAQAEQAVLAGADYLGVGPVFASSTKKFQRLSELSFVEEVACHIGLPAFAIGGIRPSNLDSVLAAGATRVALSEAIWLANDPASAVRQIRKKLVDTEELEYSED